MKGASALVIALMLGASQARDVGMVGRAVHDRHLDFQRPPLQHQDAFKEHALQSERPEHPEHPDHPEHPEHPDRPERPERPGLRQVVDAKRPIGTESQLPGIGEHKRMVPHGPMLKPVEGNASGPRAPPPRAAPAPPQASAGGLMKLVSEMVKPQSIRPDANAHRPAPEHNSIVAEMVKPQSIRARPLDSARTLTENPGERMMTPHGMMIPRRESPPPRDVPCVIHQGETDCGHSHHEEHGDHPEGHADYHDEFKDQHVQVDSGDTDMGTQTDISEVSSLEDLAKDFGTEMMNKDASTTIEVLKSELLSALESYKESQGADHPDTFTDAQGNTVILVVRAPHVNPNQIADQVFAGTGSGANGEFTTEDWEAAVANTQEMCADDFETLCGDDAVQTVTSAESTDSSDSSDSKDHHGHHHWFRRLMGDRQGPPPRDQENDQADYVPPPPPRDQAKGPGHQGPPPPRDQENGQADHVPPPPPRNNGKNGPPPPRPGQSQNPGGPIGFGNMENDKCLKSQRTDASAACRVAIAQTEAIFRDLKSRGMEPQPPRHGMGPHGHAFGVLLVLLCCTCCCLKGRKCRRAQKEKMKRTLAALTTQHQELKAAVEDAAGVSLPSPGWKHKVALAIDANPELKAAVTKAESEFVNEEPKEKNPRYLNPFNGQKSGHGACQKKKRCFVFLFVAVFLFCVLTSQHHHGSDDEAGPPPPKDEAQHEGDEESRDGDDAASNLFGFFFTLSIVFCCCSMLICACRCVKKLCCPAPEVATTEAEEAPTIVPSNIKSAVVTSAKFVDMEKGTPCKI